MGTITINKPAAKLNKNEDNDDVINYIINDIYITYIL